MFFRTLCTAMLLTASAQAQTFSPREQQMLMQPYTTNGSSGAFQPAQGKPGDKGKQAKSKPGQPPSVSISSELSGGAGTTASTPSLRQNTEIAQQKPFDQRVPFGPLSLGLQAGAPRSDSLVTPLPEGLSQFKKDRQDPYVGVSIIDIKR